MNIVSIYKIENKLFFVPQGKLDEANYTMVDPIIVSNIFEDPTILGDVLMNAIEYCRTIKIENPFERASNDTFKNLLKLTGCKSNQSLVNKARFLRAICTEEEIKLMIIDADLGRKAFMVESTIQPKILNKANVSNFEIGETIKELFMGIIKF